MLGKLALGALLAAVAIQSHAAIKSPPEDGTLVRGVGAGSETPVALMVGGARVPLVGPAEATVAGHGRARVKILSLAEYQALPEQIADGTFLTTPGGGTIWVMTGGRRSALPPDQIPLRPAQVVPDRALDQIPLAGSA
jgi:hypothetical protein